MASRWVRDRVGAVAGVEVFVTGLYDEHARNLLGWFQGRTYSAEASADLCAETFAVVIEQFDRFDPDRGTGGAWLWGIARNLLGHYQRSASVEDRARRRLAIRTPLVSSDDLDLVDARCDAAAVADLLDAAMGELSDALADAVRARVVDDKPYDLVAAECGCSVGAARARVSRGLSLLLDQLPEVDMNEVAG